MRYLLIISLIIFSFACKKETQPIEENENELITTIQLDFTKKGSGDQSTFIWEDADGPGGEMPYIEDIVLDVNAEYDVQISFWNKSVTPFEDITEEVKEESFHHRIYYEPSAGSGVTINGFDIDTNGMPLGVSSVWTTSANLTGTITVVLRHYPEGGKEAGDPVNSTRSSTDAGALFNVQMGN